MENETKIFNNGVNDAEWDSPESKRVNPSEVIINQSSPKRNFYNSMSKDTTDGNNENTIDYNTPESKIVRPESNCVLQGGVHRDFYNSLSKNINKLKENFPDITME